jgi:hypothetical protein
MPLHISICPIRIDFLEGSSGSLLPLRISDSLYVEDVTQIMQEAAFDLLAPQFYEKSEAQALKNTRYALVRRFACEDGNRPTEDESSAKALYELYLGVKVIRPTAGRYRIFHFCLSDPAPRLPRGERNDYPTILCDYESGNGIRWKDLQELAALAPSILSTLKSVRNPIAQAVQSLEIGYRADFLNVRHLLWVIGLDALFTSTERENQGTKVSVNRICNFLGARYKIYAEQPFSRLDFPALPETTLDEVLEDIYKLRNDFAHGTWPDKQWAGTACRRSLDDIRDIHYSEMLSEAASVCLRSCLRKIFADRQLVEMFSDKAKMNAHFSSKGLVRKKKKQAIA